MKTNKIGILDPEGNNINPLNDLQYSELYKQLAKKWKEFPAYNKFDEIIKAINENQITFVISGTGSGKTVLIPKFALHYTNYKGKVAVTLPKRDSVVGSAKFAALTLDVELGKQIGYLHKNSPKQFWSNENKIIYMTDGYLIMKMINDPSLFEYNVVIIDEAHERRIQIDLILLFFKTILSKRSDIKIIIMSATIDGIKYQQYFSQFKTGIINISGQPNYPIDVHYLESKSKSFLTTGQNVIDDILKLSTDDILFFVTTSNEALQVCKAIRPKFTYIYCVEFFSEQDEKLKMYAQDKDKFKENGQYTQKLVIATNAAESSITIDGLKYVVDSGYELYSYYNAETQAHTLEKRLITKAQALQRRGRVGRTEPGTCYHLITLDEFNNLNEYPEPEIVKQDLTGEIIKIIQLTESNNLSDALKMVDNLMDPPSRIQIKNAVDLYKMYQLIDTQDKITNIGKEVSRFNTLPLNRALFLIYSYQMYCAKQATQIVAMLEIFNSKISNLFYKSDTLCVSGFKNKKSVNLLEKLYNKKSDHLTFLNIFSEYKKSSDKVEWAKKYGVKLNLLNKVNELSNNYYYKLINKTKAPQISRTINSTVDEKLITCLNLSHQHKIAKNLQTIYPFKKQIGKISKESVLYDKNLKSHKFLYDELVCINGIFEFSCVTLI